MPYVRIELIEGRDEDQKAALAKAVTDALVEHVGSSPETVSLVIDDIPKRNWATAGTLLSRR